MNPTPDPAAQLLFDEYLDRLEEEGRAPDPDELCARHPEHQEALRHLFEEWRTFQSFAAGVRQEYGMREGEGLDPTSAAAVQYRRLQERRSQRDYPPLGELGRGGMGVVRKVWDPDLQRELAMKVLKSKSGTPSPRGSSGPIVRFLSEAQITGQLDHPGVVSVHEVGVNAADELFFTMTLVKGRDLSEILQLVRRGEEGWNQARVVRVLLQACDTLAYAHAKHVIHRDLKPSNIMVGRFGEVFVMDWGLAKVGLSPAAADVAEQSATQSGIVQTVRDESSTSDTGSDGLTLDGVVLGTPAYMAPEQAAGQIADLGPHSDIYSMGAMLYEVLTGTPPYGAGRSGTTPEQTLAAIRRGPPVPVHELARGCPAELQSICEKAMARRPGERYAGMKDMADDLRAYLEGRVVRSHRTGALVELQKWFGRNRLVAASLAAVLIVTLTSLATLLSYQVHTNQEITAAQTATLREARVLGSVVDWVERMFALPDPAMSRGEVVTAQELIDRVAGDLEEQVEDPAVVARLATELARLYLGLGLYARAEPFARMALRAGERAAAAGAPADPDDPGLLEARLMLAQTAAGQGRYDEAERLFAELEERTAAPDADPRHRLLYLSDRAAMAQQRDRDDEALALLRQAAEEGARVLDEDDELLLRIRLNLAVVLYELGRLDEAEPLFRSGYEGRLRALGEDHPDTLHTLVNLGYLARAQGRRDDAGDCFRRAVELDTRVLGPDHPQTLIARVALGVFQKEQGNLDDAVRILEECRETARRNLLPADPIRERCQNRLAELYQSVGRLGEARLLLTEMVDEHVRAGGADDPSLVTPLTTLASLLRQEGRADDAEQRLNEALRIQRRHPGSPAISINLLNSLGLLYQEQKEYGKAELMLGEALETARTNLGEGDQFTIRALFHLGGLRQVQGKVEDAEDLMEQAVELAREHLPETSHVRWSALHFYANLLASQHADEAALELVDEILEHASPQYHSYPNYLALRATLHRRLGLDDDG